MMGNVKAKTISERFGFSDPDLKTPEHDAIVCWFEEHAVELLGQMTFDMHFEKNISMLEAAYRKDGLTMPSLPDIPKPLPLEMHKIIECKWEPVVRNDRGFEIGFMDLCITIVSQTITAKSSGKYSTAHGFHPDPSAPLYLSSDQHNYSMRTFWIEAKPKIQSLGELFRQLSMYRGHVLAWEPSTSIVVTSPDDRHAQRIRSQGYIFIKAPTNL